MEAQVGRITQLDGTINGGFRSDQIIMGESSKFPESWTQEIQILKLAGCLQK